jgi:hypothetical protein
MYGFARDLKEIGESILLDGDWLLDGMWNGHFINEMIDALEDDDMDYFPSSQKSSK